MSLLLLMQLQCRKALPYSLTHTYLVPNLRGRETETGGTKQEAFSKVGSAFFAIQGLPTVGSSMGQAMGQRT